MPDLGPAVGGLLDLAGPALRPLLRVAARAVFGTLAGLAALALAVAWACYLIGARGGSSAGGLWAVGVALALAVVLAPLLAVKRAVGAAALHAVSALGLGRRAVSLVFDGILGFEGEGAPGERGTAPQRALERLPLAEVGRRLRLVVTRITGTGRGFLMSRVRASLLAHVEGFTLEGLRAEGDSGGGIDLLRARTRLEAAADGALRDRVRGALALTTAVMVGGWAAVALLAALIIGG